MFQNGSSAKVFPENDLFILHIVWGEGGDFSSIFSSRVKKIEKLYFDESFFLKSIVENV